MGLVFRRADAEWVQHHDAWGGRPDRLAAIEGGALGSTAGGVGFLARLTPTQRCVLGWPAPGAEYWTAATIEAVAARYPGLDTEPYTQACGGGARL